MMLKQDRMTSAERMDALFHYRKPDRVPIQMLSIGFCGKNLGHSIETIYTDPERCFRDMVWTAEQYGWDPIPLLYRHTLLGAHDFGGEVHVPKGEYEGAMVVVSPPVKSEADVEMLKMPDPKRAGGIEIAMRFAKLQAEHGLPVTFFSRSPMTMAANICGLERFCRWIIKSPELCHRLTGMAIDHICNVLKYWVGTFGGENVFVFMSSPSESNQVISPKHFEKFALPYHLEYHRRMKEMGIRRFGFHICGEQNLNLPLLAEASPWLHPTILSFGHEVDIETAAQYFPQDIIFGNLEPARIQMETPPAVYELAKTAVAKGKKAAGFILSAGCQLPANAPPANVFAITKAVNDFGWYE